MKPIIFTIFASLCFSFNLLAQDKAAEKEKEALLGSMFNTEVTIEKPSEEFTELYGQEGYENKASESKIVAMFVPVEYAKILEDFHNAKETDEKVVNSGEIPYGDKTGYYNQISIPAPSDSDLGEFIGIIAILPADGGTINVSAVCPKSKLETYGPLFLKVMETVAIKK